VSVAWLLEETKADAAVPRGPLYVADDENWRASIERFSPAPGLQVFLNDIEARRDFRAEPMSRPLKEYVTSQITLAGSAEFDFPDGLRTRTTPDSSVLYRPVSRAPVFVFAAATRYQSVGYTLDFGRIERLFEGEMPSPLRPLVDRDSTQSRCLTVSADDAMRHLASRLFARDLSGALRRVFMEGAVLQLLAVQAMAAGASSSLSGRAQGRLSVHEKSAIHEARERLLSDMRDPPSLADLAEAVGLTERRLNAGFRLLYGATVFEVLRDQRLDHACEVLKAGAGSLKEVSFRVGYNHVSSFVHAFRARYGAPPRQYMQGGD
jgi:AraC-like DNA-binding protein